MSRQRLSRFPLAEWLEPRRMLASLEYVAGAARVESCSAVYCVSEDTDFSDNFWFDHDVTGYANVKGGINTHLEDDFRLSMYAWVRRVGDPSLPFTTNVRITEPYQVRISPEAGEQVGDPVGLILVSTVTHTAFEATGSYSHSVRIANGNKELVSSDTLTLSHSGELNERYYDPKQLTMLARIGDTITVTATASGTTAAGQRNDIFTQVRFLALFVPLPDTRILDATTTDFQTIQVHAEVGPNISSLPYQLYLSDDATLDLDGPNMDERLLESSAVVAVTPNASQVFDVPLPTGPDTNRRYVFFLADPENGFGLWSDFNKAFVVPLVEEGRVITTDGSIAAKRNSAPERLSSSSLQAVTLRGTGDFDRLVDLQTVVAGHSSPAFDFNAFRSQGEFLLEKFDEDQLAAETIEIGLRDFLTLLQLRQRDYPDSYAFRDRTVKVNEAYDSDRGHHADRSLHYEGRALDLQVFSDRAFDSDGQERMAGLLWLAGFDWIWNESGTRNPHLHVSRHPLPLDPVVKSGLHVRVKGKVQLAFRTPSGEAASVGTEHDGNELNLNVPVQYVTHANLNGDEKFTVDVTGQENAPFAIQILAADKKGYSNVWGNQDTPYQIFTIEDGRVRRFWVRTQADNPCTTRCRAALDVRHWYPTERELSISNSRDARIQLRSVPPGGEGENAGSPAMIGLFVDGELDTDIHEIPAAEPRRIVLNAREGTQTVDLTQVNANQFAGLSDFRVLVDHRDQLNLGQAWTLDGTQVEDEDFYRVLSQGAITMRLNGPWDWQHPLNPNDVNNDGLITPLDALLVINELEQRRVLGDDRGFVDAATLDTFPGYFYDVRGDGYGTPLDVLRIVNELNLRPNGEGSAVDGLVGTHVKRTWHVSPRQESRAPDPAGTLMAEPQTPTLVPVGHPAKPDDSGHLPFRTLDAHHVDELAASDRLLDWDSEIPAGPPSDLLR